MPNFAGTWKMKSSENFEELLKALGKYEIRSPFFFWFILLFWCLHSGACDRSVNHLFPLCLAGDISCPLGFSVAYSGIK